MNTVTYRGVKCAIAKPDVLQTLGWRRFLTYRGVNYATAEPFPVPRSMIINEHLGKSMKDSDL